ncbi:MAG TPA: Uma2 family endonuclease [Longimicrobiaceae bacterium]|nr:Uma2 family endonuclease [Longimicrobiaceae bacterium]
MNVAPLGREATLEDLHRADQKSELVGGKLLLMTPAGDLHGTATVNIVVSLKQHQRARGGGRVYGDNVGFVVDARRTFSPDAAWHTGPRTRERLLDGAPVFAVEVRSQEDYGPAAERRLAAKRADYFAAGTRVGWDVDVLREELVRVYRCDDPHRLSIYRRGEIADAEPAVAGWRMPVDELFD